MSVFRLCQWYWLYCNVSPLTRARQPGGYLIKELLTLRIRDRVIRSNMDKKSFDIVLDEIRKVSLVQLTQVATKNSLTPKRHCQLNENLSLHDSRDWIWQLYFNKPRKQPFNLSFSSLIPLKYVRYLPNNFSMSNCSLYLCKLITY